MVESLWSDDEAAAFEGDLGARVYTSRLLGRDPGLVLHGGGNTSVKVAVLDLYSEAEEILYVKGSGWDLATIEAAGFAPVRLAAAKRLATLPRLSDPEMVNALRTAMIDAAAPTPSVEAILHAVLPYRFVDHTHADAVVTITNTPDGARRVAEIYGDSVVVIPYVMPGFELARYASERFAREAGPQTIGMVLLQHGIFSWGETARESYERMIELVGRAERHLAAHGAWALGPYPANDVETAGDERGKRAHGDPAAGEVAAAPQTESGAISEPPALPPDCTVIAGLRRDLSRVAGAPMILACRRTDRAFAFARRADLAEVSQRGPATPDHVIRTKRLPLLGRDVAGYAERYRAEFAACQSEAGVEKTMLDPAPRVVLDPGLGLLAAGRTAGEAAIVAEIYEHTMDVIERAELLGGYRALPPRDLFDMEYWDLEQAKLRKGGTPPVFTGEVALVTGAASGIGKACVEALRARGAAVAGLDLEAKVEGLFPWPSYLGLRCDVTDEGALAGALERTVEAFGGLDMAVLNAGIFPPGGR